MKPNMNKYCLGFVLVFAALTSVAQNQSSSTYSPNVKTSETDIREKLVQLALQNPNYEIADRRVSIAEYNLRKAKGSWLGLFSAQGNLNELSLKSNGGGNGLNGQIFYPRYNFSLTLPLDFFSAKSNDVKAEVLSKYEDYLMNKEKFELQARITQAEYTRYKLAEKDFEENRITAEAFNKIEAVYFEQLMRKTEMQRNLNVVKLELEEMIGVPFDDLLTK
jgi:outer membrane protein TolC